jgi:xylose isomerase
VGNPGRDPLGLPGRDLRSLAALVHLLAETGAWGVNLHDHDLVLIDATPAEGASATAACVSSTRPWPISA